jgi:ATP-dependent Clp endopeptidase proteolytic subunit ClpP
MIRFVKPRIRIVGTGWVASAGALIFVAVRAEDRFCLPHTRFLLHQPAGGAGGTAADIDIEAREIIKMRGRLNRVFAEQTGQPLQRIEDDTRRNFWLGRRGHRVRAGRVHHRHGRRADLKSVVGRAAGPGSPRGGARLVS